VEPAAVSRASATAIITLTIEVRLAQPWDGAVPVEQIHKQAVDEAKRKTSVALQEISGVSVLRVEGVQVISRVTE
jgi:hypothetical protein